MKTLTSWKALRTAGAVALIVMLITAGSMSTGAQTGPNTEADVKAATPAAAVAAPARDLAGLSPLTPQAPAAGSKWYSVPAATFTPANNGITYAYAGVGCIHATTGGQWRAAINLPDGSILGRIIVNYDNPTNTAPSQYLAVTRYKYDGTFNDLQFANTRSGAAAGTGYKWDVAGPMTTNNVVDNYNYAYVFVWQGTVGQDLCIAQVEYTPPSIFGVALPSVMK